MNPIEQSLNAAERFLELSRWPRQVPKGMVAFMDSYIHEGKIDPVEPDVEHTMIGLDHLFPSPPTNVLSDIVYLHYSGMCAYAACDMMVKTSVMSRFDLLIRETDLQLARVAGDSPDDSAGEELRRLVRQRPLAPRLQQSLWLSLLHWREEFTGDQIRAAGDYWVAVHLEHARLYGRVFRSEFVRACMWTGTARWAQEHLDLYRSIDEFGYKALNEFVSEAASRGDSAIRLMVDSTPWDDHWTDQTWWHVDESCPNVDEEVMEWGFDDYPPELVNPEREAMLNESLVHVFVD